MEHSSLKAHILELEKQLMHYKLKDFEMLLADDFIEYGSSGKVFTKKDQLDAICNKKNPYYSHRIHSNRF